RQPRGGRARGGRAPPLRGASRRGRSWSRPWAFILGLTKLAARLSRAAGRRQAASLPRSGPRDAPAVEGCLVVGAGRDPARPGGTGLLLPEGGARLQVVHEELGRREGRAAVGGGGGDHHDLRAGRQAPVAMDDEAGLKRPAGAGL